MQALLNCFFSLSFFFLLFFFSFLGCGFFCTFAFYSFFSTREPKLQQYITTQPDNKLHSTGEEQLEDFMQQDRSNYATQTQGYRQSKASSTKCRVTGKREAGSLLCFFLKMPPYF
jgi:hypothetical protein